ncbi:MAG: aminotransferase class IV [Bacillota bacterium]
MSYIWLNGSLLPADKAPLELERGFLYGDGLFETLRVYGGRPFMLGEHISRLRAGAGLLGFTAVPAPEELKRAVEKTIAANGVRDGSVRLTVVRGRGAGLYPAETGPPAVLVTVRAGTPYRPELYARGFRAVLVSFPRNERSPLVFLKSLNFLENILGKKEALASGADEGLFLNTAGHLCEGTVSNVFLVDRGTLITPAVSSGLLPGITRKMIIQAAREAGFHVEECAVRPERLFTASEAFLTNSLLEVMPLVTVDRRPVGTGRPGPTAQLLRELYRRAIEKSFG